MTWRVLWGQLHVTTALSTDPVRKPHVSPGLALRHDCAGLRPLSPRSLPLPGRLVPGGSVAQSRTKSFPLFPDLPSPRGPLNWYRNIDRNWKWGCKGTGRKVSAGLVLLPPPCVHSPLLLPIALGQSWGWADGPLASSFLSLPLGFWKGLLKGFPRGFFC